jgi:PRTRC genetic system protein C
MRARSEIPMALKSITPTRIILFNGRTLADLNPDLPVGDVVRMHSAAEPTLASASVDGPTISNDGKTATYAIQTHVGHKG